MKKGDYIVIFLIIISSLLTFFLTSRRLLSEGKKYIRVTVDGKEIERVYLDPKLKGKRINIKTSYGYNTLEFTEDGVKIVAADCPDKICMHMPAINLSGDMLVCLPHKLIVEVKDQKDLDEVDAVLK